MLVVENLIKSVRNDTIESYYFYRILKSNKTFWSGAIPIEVKSYGIEVERQDTLDGKLVNIERDCIKNISPQIHKVNNLLKILYKHCVSPFHLVDILGEYVDEYIIDFENEVNKMKSN